MRREGIAFVVAALCGQGAFAPAALAGPHDALIAKHAAANGVPESLIRRVIRIESRGNARAAHAGNYGLMQIRLGTARGIGYAGDAEGLLDPDTNLNFAVKYLAGAYRAAGCDANRAVAYYQRGYYGAALRECGESPAVAVQVAQAQIKPADVIKPKVVHTETIAATPKSSAAPVASTAKFEPVRVALPPAAPQATAVQQTAAKPAPALPVSTLKTDKLTAPAAGPAPAKIELASVPLPRIRPDIESIQTPAPKAKAAAKDYMRSASAPERRHERAERKTAKKSEDNPVLAAAGESTNAVVSVLKKLVTPDKKSRHHTVEADNDPPSHIQPPQ